MTIDFVNDLIIGCIPLEAQETPPKDQSACVIEKCPICKKNIWVSEKKRQYRDIKLNVKIYCLVCIVVEQIRQGISPDQVEIVNIGKLN